MAPGPFPLLAHEERQPHPRTLLPWPPPLQLEQHTRGPGVAKQAKRMLYGFRAAKDLKVEQMSYAPTTVQWRRWVAAWAGPGRAGQSRAGRTCC